MKAQEMVTLAKYVEQKRKTRYWNNFMWNEHPGGNCGLVHPDGTQSYDCNNFVKSLINKPAIAKSTKVWDYAVPGTVIPDVNEYQLLMLCEDIVWGSFKGCVPAEVLYMAGHIGLFVGEYKDPSGIVNSIEATAAMGGGVLSSYVDEQGGRWDHKGGNYLGRWEAHGKLTKYIDYGTEPEKKIVEDGEWGKNTTLLSQKYFGVKEDGLILNQNKSDKQYCKNCIAKSKKNGSWQFNNSESGSDTVKAIEKWLGVKAKNRKGKMTYAVIKKFQKKLGVTQDGYLGTGTVKAFQHFLNTHVK